MKREKLMLLMAGFISVFCIGVQAEASLLQKYRQTVGIGYIYSSGEDEPEERKAITTYDEQGRVIVNETQSHDGSSRFTYSYEEDEYGNPCRIVEEGEDRTEFVLENQYDGDKLTEVIVTDILVNGESFREELETVKGPADENYDAFYRFETVLYCLKNYQGYCDTTVKSGPDELKCVRQEDEESVVQKIIFPSGVTEIRILCDEVGNLSETERQVHYYEENPESDLATTIVTDLDHYIIGYGQAGTEDDLTWEGMLWYKYSEERTKEETGQTYRSGTIDQTEGNVGQVDSPYGLFCYLDDAGKVVRTELRFSRMNQETQVTYYEEETRTAVEKYIDDRLVSRQEFYYW